MVCRGSARRACPDATRVDSTRSHCGGTRCDGRGFVKSTTPTPCISPASPERRGATLTAIRRVTLVQAELTGVGIRWFGTTRKKRFGSGDCPNCGPTKTARRGIPHTWLNDQRPDKLEMRGHASVLSPANDTLAHRIQGRDLDAHFEAGELTTVDVIGNGEGGQLLRGPEEGQ